MPDDEEEPAPDTSDRDYGEHQRDVEGFVAGLDGLGGGHARNVRGIWERAAS